MFNKSLFCTLYNVSFVEKTIATKKYLQSYSYTLTIALFIPRYLFYGSPYRMSRIKYNVENKTKKEFDINMDNFSITIAFWEKKIFLYGIVFIGKNVIISLDYDGGNKKTHLETKLNIQALAGFGGILYWQNSKTSVINVMNATSNDTYRNITLPRQWSNLHGLAVINNLPGILCKLVCLFIFAVYNNYY